MKTTTKWLQLFILFLATIALGRVNAQDYSRLGGQDFRILQAEGAEVDVQDCIVAFRQRFTQNELDNKPTYDCYGIRFKNAVVEFESGEIMVLDEVVTAPMAEIIGTTSSLKCSNHIVDALNRTFRGEALRPQERFSLPSFRAHALNGRSVQVATAENVIFGSRTLGRQSFSYNNRSEDVHCNPVVNPPNIQVVQNLYEQPTEDHGVLGNMGRHFEGMMFETGRMFEGGVEGLSNLFGGGGTR